MSTPQQGFQSAYPPPSDQPPVSMGQLQWYMEGMRHARLAAVFGVIGIISLGVVFGPLAIMQAKKAEGFGVAAQDGKILGWVGIGLFILWVLFFVAYIVLFAAIIANLPHTPYPGRTGP